MKKILTVLLICLLAGAAGCSNGAPKSKTANTETSSISAASFAARSPSSENSNTNTAINQSSNIISSPDNKSSSQTSKKTIVYNNKQYCFRLTLPYNWKGYKISIGKWEGLKPGEDEKVITTGPIIVIEHPLDTPQNPRADIPIMVFTSAQWDNLDKGKFRLNDCAPVGPDEIGSNSKYVFALPPRYGYGDLPGTDEVYRILNNDSLKGYNINCHNKKVR